MKYLSNIQNGASDIFKHKPIHNLYLPHGVFMHSYSIACGYQ